MLVLPRARVVRADRVGREGSDDPRVRRRRGRRRAAEGDACSARKEGPLADALLGRGGLPLHLAGHLRAEEWNGSVSAGFMIADAAPP